MRPVPQREDLLALRHTANLAARFQLDGLPEESVTELVETLAGGKPNDELMRLADGAAGNPLYLTELVDALARSLVPPLPRPPRQWRRSAAPAAQLR